MIQLFSIPRGIANLDVHDNVLHGRIVRQFEQRFAKYVGANYACSFNSASSAIFLSLLMVKINWPQLFEGRKLAIPSTIPPAVPNMVLNAGVEFEFIDCINWIGCWYTLAELGTFRIIDSAQAVHEGIFSEEANPQDLMIFSFYPTKPIGSIDGGMIVSNDDEKIEYLRKLSMNGTGPGAESWERSLEMIGWKMYMNSVQAQIADNQLSLQNEKRRRLDEIREEYDKTFEAHLIPRPDGPSINIFGSTLHDSTQGIQSYHLYRVYVQDNRLFVRKAKQASIMCGIHYRSLQHHPLYGRYSEHRSTFEQSGYEHLHVASIPFHRGLSDEDTIRVAEFVVSFQERYGPPNYD